SPRSLPMTAARRSQATSSNGSIPSSVKKRGKVKPGGGDWVLDFDRGRSDTLGPLGLTPELTGPIVVTADWQPVVSTACCLALISFISPSRSPGISRPMSPPPTKGDKYALASSVLSSISYYILCFSFRSLARCGS